MEFSAKEESKEVNNINTEKTEVQQKNDSDFEHLKTWQDNSTLDYYLSEEHWNHHVNVVLHRILSQFYEDIGVYEYLQEPLTNNRDQFYGILLNEAYRLCQIVINAKVPDAMVATLFNEAENLLLRNYSAGHQQQPSDEINHILSYHILGMINTVFSFSNEHKDGIDRFLYNLSLYNDIGIEYLDKHQSFKTYYKQYEQLVIVGLNFSSALRPEYDYKGQDEYLRKKIVWYKVSAEELEKMKQESEDKRISSLAQQYNVNSNVFNNCQVTINNMPATAEALGKKPPFVPCELKFFDQTLFGSEESQPKLIELLREVSKQIDTTSGREWFAVYAGYRYFKKQLGVKGEYTKFFSDIEHLLPDVLTKIDRQCEGEKRYHSYTQLMGREADDWYMDNDALPPQNELSEWKAHFKGDWRRYEKLRLVIIDVCKRFMQL